MPTRKQLSILMSTDFLCNNVPREFEERTNVRGSWMAGIGQYQQFPEFTGKIIGRWRYDFEKGTEVFEHINEYAGEPGFNSF